MMLFSRKKENIGETKIVDIHAHILPGIDDGAKDFQESFDMAKTAYKNGVRSIIATPHNKEYIKSASPKEILMLVNKLQLTLEHYGVPVKIYPGNEIMRAASQEDLTRNEYLDMNNSGYVLVEFKPSDSFNLIERQLNNILRTGNKIILAHIERYDCFLEDYSLVKRIIDMGVLIQVNHSSVVSVLDNKVNKFVRNLLKNKMVDFISSDAHNNTTRKMDFKKCVDYLYEHYDSDYVDDLLYKNAVKYLGVEV